MTKILAASGPVPFVISDRPANRGPVLAGLLAVAAFFGGFGGWAATAPLSSAAVAPGQVKVDSHRKTVQHLEGGIIREILVREGDRVEQGRILLRMDDTGSRASLDLLRGQHDALRAQEARLVAERDNRAQIAFPPALAARRDDPNVAAGLIGQEMIFASRWRALEGQTDILMQRIAQLRAEIGANRAQVAALDTQSALIKEEIKAIEGLVEKGLERRPRLLALQREQANLEGHRGQQLGLIAKAQQGIGEAEMQMIDLKNRRASEVASELRDAQAKLADLEEKLRATADIVRRTEIRAPQSGRVVSLRHFTAGGVVGAGDPILEIVPRDDKLVIEAQVRIFDIDSVHEDLPAEVRFTGLKQRRMPTLAGTVVHVSADSLVNERSGEPYYLARIEVAPEQLARLEGIKLYPGMPAEAMIVTGTRTALDYLLEPIRDSFHRALREE